MHVANGMYGLILVEPKEGLPPVDREYYVMQGDFYTKGKFGEKGLQPFDMEKAVDENADYVVFNGAVGSLVGDKALQGQGRRDACGSSSATAARTSCRRFHVIGEIFDHVYTEGGTRCAGERADDAVPAGGSAIVEFKVEVPGTLHPRGSLALPRVQQGRARAC